MRGLNAVAVIDLGARRLEGYIPAGWFPSMVALTNHDRTLIVSSAKGLGSGPNGGRGFVDPPQGATAVDVMKGTLQIVAVPDARELALQTQRVIDNTYSDRDIRLLARALPSRKTTRFVGGTNWESSTSCSSSRRTGRSIRCSARGRASTGTRRWRSSAAASSPNHQALADRFTLFNNFYCDSDQSNTGHRWVVGVYPNEWVEVNARSRIEARLFSTAPGRRYVAGTAATVLPEDYNEAGALWEHLTRHGVSFYNFGFGTEMPASLEQQMFKETGIRMSVSFPLPKPLFDRTSRSYPTFNMAIPDQYRVDVFEQELRERWESGREPFPQLVTMVLPQDHLTEPHPDDGYPFRESYMADNDLALGRIMQTLSHSRWWPDMLVIVAEDDPQGGRDHVDAHRSILMLAGPQVRRGYVSPTLASFGSIMRLFSWCSVCRRSTSSTPWPLCRLTPSRRSPIERRTTRSCRIASLRSGRGAQAIRSPVQLEGARRVAGDGRSGRHAPPASASAPPLAPLRSRPCGFVSFYFPLIFTFTFTFTF